MRDLIREFEFVKDRLKVDDTAVALIILASVLQDNSLNTDSFADEISHAICMGIRKGLFGKGADDDADLRDSLAAIAGIDLSE